MTHKDKVALLNAIDIVVQKRIEKLQIPYWIEGKIASIIDDIHTVMVSGTEITVKAREGLSLSEGDIVLICVPNGDYSKKFIDVKR